MERARLLIEQSRFDLAEQELRRFLTHEPDNGHAHALMAFTLSNLDKNKEAEKFAQSAIGLAPDVAFHHYTLGIIRADQDDLKGARQAVDEALRLDPEDSDCFGLLSQIYLLGERWEEAKHAAEQGLAQDPTHQLCLNCRAQSLVKLRRHGEAHETIGQALKESPEDAYTHANLGWTHLHEGRQQKALEHFSEALRLDPELEWARGGLVEALKARYFVYRWLLRFFLWMSCMSPKTRGILIFGAYILVRVLNQVAKSQPDLAPFILPISITYMVFVLLTWIVSPLFDFVLLFNRYGRYALSDEKRKASYLFGTMLIGAMLSGIVGAMIDADGLIILAINLGILILPTRRLIGSSEFSVESAVGISVLILTLLALTSVIAGFAGLPSLGYSLTGLNFLILILMSWGSVIGSLGRKSV